MIIMIISFDDGIIIIIFIQYCVFNSQTENKNSHDNAGRMQNINQNRQLLWKFLYQTKRSKEKFGGFVNSAECAPNIHYKQLHRNSWNEHMQSKFGK